MNLHTPERQAHETQEQYRLRQAKSRHVATRTFLVHDSAHFGTYRRPEPKPMSRRDKHRSNAKSTT